MTRPAPLRPPPVTQDIVTFLSQPASYPESTRAVEVVETHMARVFLTDAYAWKLKKPVRLDFLDFSTPDLRRRVCEEEVRLNRRLAPDVYLGVRAVVRDAAGSFRIAAGADGDAVDWLVRMRRLPGTRMLDRVLAAGGPDDAELAAVGDLLVRFYRDAPVESISPAAYVMRLTAALAGDVRDLCAWPDDLPVRHVEAVGALLHERLRSERERFAARAARGRVVEAHGDLRPEHICLGPPPVVIDCLEFRREVRFLDPVDELAFLGLECERLGQPRIGPALMRMYEAGTGDRDGWPLVDTYAAMRALLRAKLAIWHLRDAAIPHAAHWRASARGYVALAARRAGLDVSAPGAR